MDSKFTQTDETKIEEINIKKNEIKFIINDLDSTEMFKDIIEKIVLKKILQDQNETKKKLNKITIDDLIEEQNESNEIENIRREIKNQNMRNYYVKNKERIIARQTAYNKRKNEENKIIKNKQTELIN